MTSKQEKLIENYVRSKVRSMLKEGHEVDLWEKIEKPLETLKIAFLDLKNNTSDKNWKSALSSLENDIDKFEMKAGSYARKLGIIPLN